MKSRSVGKSLLGVGAALTLAACGSLSGGSTSNGGGTTLGASQGVTSDTITLGYSGPLAGPYALAGASEKSGIDAAINEANAAGGVHGRKIKLISLDDGLNTARLITNLRELTTQDGAYAIVGSPSLAAGTAYEYIGQAGIPFFGLQMFPDPHLKNVFVLGPNQTAQTVAAMGQLAKMLNGKPSQRVAAVYLQSTTGKATIHSELQKYPSIQLVSEQDVPFTTQDVTPFVLNAKAANPDVMLMFATSTQDLLMLKVMAAQNFKPLLLGVSGTLAEQPTLALDGAQGAYRSAGFMENGSGIDTYNKWVQTTGQPPSDQSVQNYGSTKLILHIMKLCGDDLSWSHFQRVAEGLKSYETGIYAPTTFGPLPDGHHASDATMIQQIINHQWQAVGPFVQTPAAYHNGV